MVLVQQGYRIHRSLGGRIDQQVMPPYFIFCTINRFSLFLLSIKLFKL
jgi:hypothetical protein